MIFRKRDSEKRGNDQRRRLGGGEGSRPQRGERGSLLEDCTVAPVARRRVNTMRES